MTQKTSLSLLFAIAISLMILPSGWTQEQTTNEPSILDGMQHLKGEVARLQNEIEKLKEASINILVYEDFESYHPNQIAGNWNPPLFVSNGKLGSQVADSIRRPETINKINWCVRSLPVSLKKDKIYFLSFDAWVTSTSGSGAYFSAPSKAQVFGWELYGHRCQPYKADEVYVGHPINVLDKQVRFCLVLNPIEKKMYAGWNLGQGYIWTMKTSLNLDDFCKIDSITFYQDLREGRDGSEFDNIVLLELQPNMLYQEIISHEIKQIQK